MNEQYTTENLKEGMGVEFDCFGGKVIFTSDKLEEMKNDNAISLLPRRSLWQKIKDKINFYKGRGKITWTKDL